MISDFVSELAVDGVDALAFLEGKSTFASCTVTKTVELNFC